MRGNEAKQGEICEGQLQANLGLYALYPYERVQNRLCPCEGQNQANLSWAEGKLDVLGALQISKHSHSQKSCSNDES